MKASSVTALILIFSVLIGPSLFGCQKTGPADDGFVIGVGSDRYSVSEHKFNFAILGPNPNVYETLLTLDPEFQPRPLLAEKWEETAPGVWRMALRKGVRFHNGEPFDAEAAKYSLVRFAKYRANFLQLEPDSVKVIDSHTIELRSKTENAFFIGNLAHPLVVMMAPGIDVAETPTGTGPFRFVKYRKNHSLVIERNPDYWGSPATLDRITFRFIPDPHVRLLAVSNKELDLAGEIPGAFLDKFKGDLPFKLFYSRPAAYVALSMTTRGEPPFDLLSDRAIRRAINYAVNREEIIEVVWRGLGEESPGIVPELSKTRGYRYDAVIANQLLDEAGWKRGEGAARVKSGRPLSLRLIVGFPESQFFGQAPELLKDQLEQAGIGIEIVRVSDSGVYYDHYMKKGQGDLWLESGSNRTGDPTYLLFNLYHSATEWVWYRSLTGGEAFDEALSRGRRAKTIEEARAWVAEASRILVDEEAAIAPIALLPNFYAGSDRIQKFEPHPLEGLDLYSRIQVMPARQMNRAELK